MTAAVHDRDGLRRPGQRRSVAALDRARHRPRDDADHRAARRPGDLRPERLAAGVGPRARPGQSTELYPFHTFLAVRRRGPARRASSSRPASSCSRSRPCCAPVTGCGSTSRRRAATSRSGSSPTCPAVGHQVNDIGHSVGMPSRVVLPQLPDDLVPDVPGRPIRPCPSLRNQPCRAYLPARVPTDVAAAVGGARPARDLDAARHRPTPVDGYQVKVEPDRPDLRGGRRRHLVRRGRRSPTTRRTPSPWRRCSATTGRRPATPRWPWPIDDPASTTTTAAADHEPPTTTGGAADRRVGGTLPTTGTDELPWVMGAVALVAAARAGGLAVVAPAGVTRSALDRVGRAGGAYGCRSSGRGRVRRGSSRQRGASQVVGELGQRGVGVDPAGRGHHVDAALRRARRAGPRPRPCGRRRPASRPAPRSRRARGASHRRCARGGPRRPGTRPGVSSSARGVARLTRSVMPRPWWRRAWSGSRSRLATPGGQRGRPEAVAGAGEGDAGVGRVQARVEPAHQQAHAGRRRCRPACGPAWPEPPVRRRARRGLLRRPGRRGSFGGLVDAVSFGGLVDAASIGGLAVARRSITNPAP